MTAIERMRSLKRTASYLLRGICTLRFDWLNRAAHLVRPANSPVLCLADNEATREAVKAFEHALADAA